MKPIMLLPGMKSLPVSGYAVVTIAFERNGRVKSSTVRAEVEPDLILRMHEDIQIFKSLSADPKRGE